MDFPSVNPGDLQRHFAVRPRLLQTGHIEHKRQWVRHSFGTYNFSFVIAGSGFVKEGGGEVYYEAPFVVVQKPGEFCEYGPGGASDWWEEIFLLFDPAHQREIESTGYCLPGEHAWRAQNKKRLMAALTDLRAALGEVDSPGGADRVDRLAHLCVIESRVSAPRDPTTDATDQIVRRIRQQLERDFHREWRFEETARAHGISYTTFRRVWSRLFSYTPNQFLTELRMQEARRLLANTSDPIGTIAQRVGYEDPLYFSRRFRQQHGQSARGFRRLHR